MQLPESRKGVDVLGHQLLRSGTSVPAHAREASLARSTAEFCSKIEGALQEAEESHLWLELLQEDCGIEDERIQDLLRETGDIIAIFASMAAKLKKLKREGEKR